MGLYSSRLLHIGAPSRKKQYRQPLLGRGISETVGTNAFSGGESVNGGSES
jgi:hypothetical protein